MTMMTGKTFEVDEQRTYKGKTWWEMRPAMIQMPAQTWAALKAYIIKSCKNNKQCSDAASWERTVQIIDEKVQSKLP